MLVFHFTACSRRIQKPQIWIWTLGDTSSRHFIWNPVLRIMIHSYNRYNYICPSFIGRATTAVLWFALWPHRLGVLFPALEPLCVKIAFSPPFGFLSSSKDLQIRQIRSSKLLCRHKCDWLFASVWPCVVHSPRMLTCFYPKTVALSQAWWVIGNGWIAGIQIPFDHLHCYPTIFLKRLSCF